MAKLVLSMDGLALKEIPLSKDRMTIGRKSHNDIQIDNLAISGEHAVLVTVLNDSFIEDLNSTNGTLVNGQPIRKHFLQNGDLIEMGKYQIKFITDASVARDDTSLAGNAVGARSDLAPPAASAEPIFPAQTPRTSPGDTLVGGQGAVPQLGSIQVLNGVNAGKELELVKALTTLGKPGVQVAVITRRPLGYFISHVEGGQFPVVNGKTLDAQAHPLADHDVIEIAGVKMEFFFKD